MTAAPRYAVALTLTADGSAAVNGVKVVEAAVDRLAESADKAAVSVKGVTGGAGAAGAEMAGAAQRAAAMAGATDGAGAAALGAAAGARSLALGAGAAALGLGGAATAAGVFAVSAAKTAEAAAAMDRRLAALTGTGAALAETKAWLAESADRLGKSLPALADGYARLNPMMRSGLLTTAQARDLTLGLIDAQVAFGASADSMGNVLYGLSQALSSPIVRMEELNQVVEPLPGLLADLDKAAGLPAGGFRALVAAGKATDAVFRDTLIKALKSYEGTAAQAATGFEGSTTRMAEAWRQLQIRIGNAATPGLTNSANAGTAALTWITRQFDAITEYNAEGDLARLRLWAQELARKRDAALTSLFRVSEGVWADKNLQAAFAAALAGIEQDIANTEAAIIDLEKRLGLADRSLTGALNAAAGKTGAQTGEARTAADALRGAWVAAAEAAGLQTDAIGRLKTSQDELNRHTAALAKVAALPPEELRKLGISAGDVTRAAELLRQALDPATAAIKALNDETMRINAGKFGGLADAMAGARPMQGRPTSDDQGTAEIADAWRRKRAATSDEIIQQLRDEAEATKRLGEAQATGNPLEIAFAKAKADTVKAIKDGLDPAKEELYYEQALNRELAALAGNQGAAATAYDQAADVRVLSAKRLAEAQALGVEAVREAEIVNRAAAQAEAERVALDSARGQAILAKVRAEEKWKQAASESAALRAANDNLNDLRAEIALYGQSAALRERAVRSIQIQRQAVEQFGIASSDAARQWIALQEEIADAQAIQRFQEDVNRVSEDIAGDLATAMFEGMAGSETDILDWFKGLLKRMAIEIVKQQFILPITTQIVSAVPGLFGISGPVTGAQAAAAAAGQGGGLGSTGDLLSLGSKFMPSSWTNGLMSSLDTWGATSLGIGSAATMPASITMGANGMLAGGGATSIVPGQVAAGTGLSAYLGSAGVGALGGFLGGMLGTAADSKAVGALSGAALGAGGAGLASLLGFGAAGGPVGLAIAAVAGAITGALGTSKKPKTEASAYANLDQRAAVSDANTGSRYQDAGPVAAARDAVVASLQALVTAGATFDGVSVNIRAMGDRWETWSQGFAGHRISTSDDPATIVRDYVRWAASDAADVVGKGRPALGLSDIGRRAAATSTSTGEDYIATIALAEQVAAGAAALQDFDQSLAGIEAAAKKAAAEGFAPLTAELAKASDGGFAGEYRALVAGQMRQMLDQMAAPVEYSALEQAMASAAGEMAALRQASIDLGLGLEGAVDAAAAAVKSRLLSQANDEIAAAIDEAAGRGWRNSAREIQAEYQATARTLAALGGDGARALDLAGAKLTALLGGLDEAAALDAVSLLTGDLAALGGEALAAARASQTAAAAQAAAANAATQAAAAADDLARRYAAVTAAGGGVTGRIDALRAQAGADAAIDHAKAVAILRAGVTDLAANLPLAQLISLREAYTEATVAGQTLAEVVADRLAAEAAALALQQEAAAEDGYRDSLTAIASAGRSAAAAMRGLAASLTALPDRLALDDDLSTLDPAGRLDEAWRQLTVKLTASAGGVTAEMLAAARAGDAGALTAALRGGALDAGAAQGIDALIEATLRQARGYYADLGAYNQEYDALTGVAAAVAAAADVNAAGIDRELAAVDRQIAALGGAVAATERSIASMADLRGALEAAAATWRDGRGDSGDGGGDGTAAAAQAAALAAGGTRALVESLGVNWSDVTNHAALLGGNLDQAAAWAAIASTAGYRGSAGRGEIGDYLGRRLAADPYDAAAHAALNLGGAVNADGGLADDVLAKIAVAKQLGYAGGWLPGQFEAYYRAASPDWRAAYDGAVQTYTGWERPVVRAYAAGGEITGGVTGRDSALVLAMPGERILSLRQAEQMDAIHAAAVRQAGGVSVAVDLAPLTTAVTAGSAATIRAIDASAARVVGAVDALGGEIARLNRVIADQGREIARLAAIVGRLAA